MKHWVKMLSILLFFYLIFLPKNIEARSGCCSHHGGVCGCGCCDGTGLSATCAPYYPECNRRVVVPILQSTKIPVKTIPKNTPIPTVNYSTQALNTNSNQTNSSDNSLSNLMVLGLIGFGGYKLVKKIRNKK